MLFKSTLKSESTYIKWKEPPKEPSSGEGEDKGWGDCTEAATMARARRGLWMGKLLEVPWTGEAGRPNKSSGVSMLHGVDGMQ